MRRSPLPLGALLLLSAASHAQLPSDVLARVDEALAPWQKQNEAATPYPGGVVGVFHDGKVVYAKAIGMGNLETLTPLTEKTPVDIGSVTKHFTSTALLILEDEGKLSLSDDIRKWVPALPNYGKTITLRHLLNHTSGLRDYLTCLAIAGWQMNEPLDDAKSLEMITRQRGLNFPTGTSWNYSNTGYFLAAQIVAKASGMKLSRFLDQRVFKPLQMSSAHLYDEPTDVVPGRADSYRKLANAWRRVVSSSAPVGDGGLLMSLEDFAKWDHALRTNKLGLKEPGHLKRLTEKPAMNGYGLGLATDALGGVARISHGGDWLGYNAHFALFPDKPYSVASLSNDGAQNGKNFGEAVSRALFGVKDPAQQPGADETPWTEDAWKKIEGHWTSPAIKIRLSSVGGARNLQAEGQPALPLFLRKDGTAFLKIVPLVLTPLKKDDKGVWTEMQLEQQTPNGPVKLTLTRTEPFRPKAEDLEKWVGRWFCPDLKVVFTLRSNGSALFFSSSGSPGEAPLAMSSDIQGSLGVVTLTYIKGDVPTLRLNAGRANNFILERIRPRAAKPSP